MINENDLEHDIFRECSLTESSRPVPQGMSVFAHYYLDVYCRLLPNIVLFDDVRDNVADAHVDAAFLKEADNFLPWVAFHFFFESVLPPEFVGSRVWSLSDLERFGLGPLNPFEGTEISRRYFEPLHAKLLEAEEDQLAEGFERLLHATDRGVRSMTQATSERLMAFIRATRLFLRMLREDRPPNAFGALLAILNVSLFPGIEGDAVYRYLVKHTRTS